MALILVVVIFLSRTFSFELKDARVFAKVTREHGKCVETPTGATQPGALRKHTAKKQGAVTVYLL